MTNKAPQSRRLGSLRQRELDTLRFLIAKYGLVGIAEAADCLDVHPQNVRGTSGMPQPVVHLRATTIWVAAEIEDFAVGYQERRSERAARKERAA